MDGKEPEKMTIADIKAELIDMGYEDDVFNAGKLLKKGWVELLREKRTRGPKPVPKARGDTLVANAEEAFRQLGLTTRRSSSPDVRVASPPRATIRPTVRIPATVPLAPAPAPKSSTRRAVELAAALPLPPRK